MKTVTVSLIALMVGAGLGYAGNQFMAGSAGADPHAVVAKSKEPLYWVAPMDPNYKRDKPGKSPMGMDLVPVYEEEKVTEPGTVMIDPAVENNLGVKSAEAELSKLSAHIDTVGYIDFDQSRTWQINARVAGWVEKLHVDAVGEQVKKGDVLFELYSPELVKAQEELISAYRSGRDGLINGAQDRLRALGVDNLQIQQIKRLGRASQTIQIKAPSDGVIASLTIREGGYLSPAQAALRAGPIDEVWVDAEVFERQSQWVSVGDEAMMKLDALPGKEWQGHVDYIYPILDQNTRTLKVRLKFANEDRTLKPNMFANVTLLPEMGESVLTVPREAIIRSGGMTRVVLALGDGKYRSARVEAGREAGGRIEILSGLQAEDWVVTSAQFLLDSESSQSADLSRINGKDKAGNKIWVEGSISMLMADFGMITVEHQAVSQWGWDAGEMNFTVEDDVSLGEYSEGEKIRFLVEKQDNQFALTALQKAGGEQ